MKKFVFIFVMCLFIAGCASLKELTREAATVPPEEIAQQTEAAKSILGGILDEPYETGGSIAFGYILALLRQLYKKKKRNGQN